MGFQYLATSSSSLSIFCLIMIHHLLTLFTSKLSEFVLESTSPILRNLEQRTLAFSPTQIAFHHLPHITSRDHPHTRLNSLHVALIPHMSHNLP
ncbi:hypothetical protein DFS34DRAFT_616108 [Phlyctochytrium arcticum]|nr:hypothetical protein DFS34DRAFT_616108 [Phlyctochytrium arcticum]